MNITHKITMAHIIPYAAYPAMTGTNAVTAFNAAAGAGKFAYKNRKAAAKAAQTIAKMWRQTQSAKKSRKANIARKIGEDVGTNTSKKCQVASNIISTKDTRTLYHTELVDIQKQTADQIDRRERDAIHVLGFKIRFHVANNVASQLTKFTYAVIASKNLSASAPTTNLFFRDYSSARGIDFGGSLNAIQFSSYPVNSDLFRVLHKGTITLSAPSSSNATFQRSIEKWVKLDRQITYQSLTGTPNTRIFVVYWADRHQGFAGDPVITGGIDVLENHVTYFREPELRPRRGAYIN